MNLPIRTVYQGDTVILDFELVEPSGAKLDLTGCTIEWSMSDPADLDTPLLSKTSGSGITVVSALNGACRVTIPAGQLDTPGTYVQEIEAVLPGGATYTYGQGGFIVRSTVMPA